MNKLIYDFLDSYTKNPNPQYAVFLKGEWGCGKTHFIKQWKKQFEGEEDNENDIILKPIYVSTYGMKNLSEVRKAIDRELNPFFYSKTGKFIKAALKFAGKIAFKTDFDINGDGKGDGSFSATLDSLSLLQKRDEGIKGVKFLIFDDIERCQIDFKELLGFINYFVEHYDCHTIVIGDESHLGPESKKILEEFKEKTIGREFEIKADIEEAVRYFLNEVPISSYLQEMHDFIIKCFKCTDSSNLRMLRQCLYDFKEQLEKVPSEFSEDITSDNIYLKHFLASFIAIYFEFNNKDNRELLSNWEQKYSYRLLPNKDDDKRKIQAIIDKYSPLNEDQVYHIFHLDLIDIIISHIISGVPFVNSLANYIKPVNKEIKPWDKLYGYYDMEQLEFEETCTNLISSITDNNMLDITILGMCTSYLSYFDSIRIFSFTDTSVLKLKEKLETIVKSVNNLETLYLLRRNFMRGCDRLYTNGNEPPIKIDICQYAIKLFEEQENILPNAMQIALNELTEESVDDLVDIDEMVLPDHSTTYNMSPIFEDIDSNKLFESICHLSNKGRNKFARFLSSHYKFNCDCTNIENRYKNDLTSLLEIQNLVNNKLTMSPSVDLLSYKYLNQTLMKAIQRCKGEKSPL